MRNVKPDPTWPAYKSAMQHSKRKFNFFLCLPNQT